MSSAEPGGGRKSSGKSDRFTKRRRQRLKRTRSDGYVLNLSSAEGVAPPSPNDGDATAARPPSDGGEEEDGTAFLWWIRSPTVQSLGRLRRAIRSNDRDWIKGFLDFDGLGLLFQCLKNLAPQSSQQHRHHLSDMVLRMECVMCIREVVNSQTGLDCLLSMRQRRDDIFGRRFASVLQTKNVMVKMQIFELLSALCLYSKDGYYLTLDALEKYKTWQKFSYRFSLLVNELHAADLTPFKISIMALINSILFTNEKLRDRMRIRNEFLALNIQEIIVAVVKSDADPDLQVQCDVFEDEMAADNEAFEEIRESESINIGSHQELFHAIFMRVQQTPLAAPFLSLLQSLFQINAADLQCEAVWNRLEDVVQKIVAAEVGDSSQLELGSSLPSSTSQYQDIGVQTDVSQPQAMSEPLREQKGAAADISPDGETLASSTSSPIICSIPPPPPLPASMAPPPAPITGVPPPPPPPLLLGNSAPSATHPPPSAGNTPVPPPPPPGLVRTPCFDLPSIQTRDPQCKMRTFSWNKVPTSALSGVSIWKDVLKMSDSIDVKYEKLEELFGQKDAPPAAEKQLGKSLRSHGMSAEISLIDPKKSMNINIFLKQFRKSNEEIIQLIENADSRAFGVEKLKGLMKLLPQQDEVDLIEHFDGEYEKLGSAEKFYCQLIKVPSYKARIEAMLLKGDFSSQLCMIQPNIQILNSVNLCLIDNSSLKDFLRLVLHTGNFINKGSAGGNAYGFRISSLNKLVMTRSNVPRISLLHHLVEEAEKQDEHALKFVDDLLEPLQKASRLESIKTEFNQLRTNVHQLKGQLEHTEKEVFDHFKEFLQGAEAELENIGTSVEQIDKTSEKLAQHYCENLRSFNLCEFLNTFREFCEKVKTCQQENENRLQQIQNAERRKRAQEELLEKRKGFQKQEEKKKIVDNLVNEIKRGKVLRRLSLRKKVVKLAPAELEESYL